jgi:hypothetical protein
VNVVLNDGPDDRWGELTLRFVYDGEPPKRPIPLVGGMAPDDERLVVHAKNGGIKNIVVWLHRPLGQPPPPVHPMYEADAKATVEMTAAVGRFEPRVVLLRTTQTLKVVNADVIGYNARADFFHNAPFNWLLRAGDNRTVTLPKPEVAPSPVSCAIHPWMEAYLLVRDDPYAAVSDENGELQLTNLPVGKWSFKVWHEVGYVKEASIGGKAIAWPRGIAEFEIKPGNNDVGEIKLSPKTFERR